MNPNLSTDPWQMLKSFTAARIALGRVGSSLPTQEILDFGCAHALARDAVHRPLDVGALDAQLQLQGFRTLQVNSQASGRDEYLLRPDLGRRLSIEACAALSAPTLPQDLLFVVGDGLSSLAVERHVAPLLAQIIQLAPSDWRMDTVVIATQARVALGDKVGALLQAKMVLMMVGERPGLSSPDSLGLYLTHNPKIGRNDAERNCISNVRPEGLNYPAAAHKLVWLAQQAMRHQVTGIGLKDESDAQLHSANEVLMEQLPIEPLPQP